MWGERNFWPVWGQTPGRPVAETGVASRRDPGNCPEGPGPCGMRAQAERPGHAGREGRGEQEGSAPTGRTKTASPPFFSLLMSINEKAPASRECVNSLNASSYFLVILRPQQVYLQFSSRLLIFSFCTDFSRLSFVAKSPWRARAAYNPSRYYAVKPTGSTIKWRSEPARDK